MTNRLNRPTTPMFIMPVMMDIINIEKKLAIIPGLHLILMYNMKQFLLAVLGNTFRDGWTETQMEKT